MSKTLLCVDGNSILNRSFYGIRPLTTKDGLFTNAVYGFVNILFRQLETWKPDFAVVAFDVHAPTFRHKVCDTYKAGRRPMPEELRMQFPYAKECAAAMGFLVSELPGYEADDLLGTCAAHMEENGDRALLLTGDRDALQLISDHVTVLLATNRETVTFDRARFTEEYGIAPEQFVDCKALMGDSSDNIPGVPGIGEKTALKLIAAYGSLDAVYDGLDEKPLPAGQIAKLAAGRESAYASRYLATICKTVPLPFEDGAMVTGGMDTDRLRPLFEKLEFAQFLDRLSKLTVKTEAVPDEEEACEMLPPETLDALPPEPFAVYLEDDTVYAAGAFAPRGVCFGPFAAVAGRLASRAENLCVFDSKALFHRFADLELRVRTVAFDCMTAAYVLDASLGHFDLSRVTLQYLHKALPAGGGGRAAAVYELSSVLRDRLESEGSMQLYREIEQPLSGVLCDMELAGFQIDYAGIKQFGEQLSAMCDMYRARVFFAAGEEFNLNSPKQLGEVLFEKLRLPARGKTKTGWSTSAEVLEKLRPYHPIISDILDYRQVAKLKSTYADGLLRVADPSGRVHSSFHQTITATGRLSSSEPNLQNIPIRTDLGRELRRFFIPRAPGRVLIDADYSQIELRLLAAVSGDENMTAAFRDGADIHTATASQVFGTPPELVTREERKRAKAVNFGIVYGIGDYSLSVDLGVSKRVAGDYIASYLAGYPGVAAYLKRVVEEARRDGYVTTMLGRRRYIPELTSSKKTLQAFGERVAMNSPIQGTAADLIKLAMVRMDAELRRRGLDATLILQVHDELIVDSAADVAEEVGALMKKIMEQIYPLSVPLTVDVEAGETWFEGH